MCRLRFIEPEEADPLTRKLFSKKVVIPNLLCIMANSEVVIDSFANYNANLDKFKLSVKYREIISLAVSQFNRCPYCIALHTSNAVDGGILTHRECLEARRRKSPDPKINVILKLTNEILEKRGHISDQIISKVKQQGFIDEDIIEAIAIISLIIQANYTASVSKPEIDFLEPPPLDEE
ncbi:MAG: carboxymuconolactone decarboxylase family protein [candidate division Zixibacteria bacterium]|nr:carboxymuconolactone decarboxylase family protein [candidate division Zixibacteria bacterium]